MFEFSETSLDGVIEVTPKTFKDDRGFLTVPYIKDTFFDNGIWCEFIQDNHSHSSKNVLRGMHFQLKHAQDKLVRCVRGAIFDVAVDVRVGSPTFGKWYGTTLSSENNKMLFVPKNFAHGFYVLSDKTDVHYKVSDIYHPDSNTTLAWDDFEIDIQWPEECKKPILSDADQSGMTLANLTAQNKLPIYHD